MKLLSSLDPKDRRMLLISLGLILGLFVLLAFLTPAKNEDDSPVPSSYRTGKHGARAAYTLLEQSGYKISRWEEPIAELAARAGPETVLILAEPYSQDTEDKETIRVILQKGGRVVATGFEGGLLLPGNAVAPPIAIQIGACEAQAEGIGPLAAPGTVWMARKATWKDDSPRFRTVYTCGPAANVHPVVVEYEFGTGKGGVKGHAVWWAGSTPLENSFIAKDRDLDLLLNSVGPAAGRHIYWDESLHGNVHSAWDYTSGPVWPLLLCGVIGLGLLVVLSYSRRSGPARPLPEEPRTTPIEFLEALGALYRSAGATATATQIAWDRFRTQAALLSGLHSQKRDARALAAVIQRRFGAVTAGMEPDLIAAEEACWDEALKPRRALVIVQALHRHEETLRAASMIRRGVRRKAG